MATQQKLKLTIGQERTVKKLLAVDEHATFETVSERLIAEWNPGWRDEVQLRTLLDGDGVKYGWGFKRPPKDTPPDVVELVARPVNDRWKPEPDPTDEPKSEPKPNAKKQTTSTK